MKGINAGLKIGHRVLVSIDISIEPMLLTGEHTTIYTIFGIVFSSDTRGINGVSLCVYPFALHAHWSKTREPNGSSVRICR